MKFCRRENFSEKFQEKFRAVKKNSVCRINHKRYKLQYLKCLLNIMSV